MRCQRPVTGAGHTASARPGFSDNLSGHISDPESQLPDFRASDDTRENSARSYLDLRRMAS